MSAAAMVVSPAISMFADLIFLFGFWYFFWLYRLNDPLPFKLPKTAKCTDNNNPLPGGGFGKADGILYLGNQHETDQEIWFANTDARTHILYLGTTGAGKTEGLKSISSNALCWGSGYIYVDGKADTDLWSSISALARRFGRDDDLLIMNYMTGNSEGHVASNTLNPFSSGSPSYLTNMLVSLMPDAEGDNAMWKERAVALVSALMPCLVYKRDKQNIPLSVSVIRQYLGFGDIIRLSRDSGLPEEMRVGLTSYLSELPGYVDEAFDDDGNEKPMPPDAPMVDSSVPRQQHGYLSMQFTRSLQSLGDDYGYIFDTQAADVDMMDVVLNRRILIVLIPALEKSSDETANLGKIIASTLKGMMGGTLGNTVEGDVATAIDNKVTRAPTPFMAIFDEVGYYAAQGMAVMAAQARSLGFCLIYAAQDLPAMQKRIKEEARSITANCNIKIFGKLEDPTETKDFFEKTVGQAMVTEVSGFTRDPKSMTNGGYGDSQQANVQVRARADYGDLRAFTEGRAICTFGKEVAEIQIYYSNPGNANVMRVQRFLPIPPPSEEVLDSMRVVDKILKRIRSKRWDPSEYQFDDIDSTEKIEALAEGFAFGMENNSELTEASAFAVANVAYKSGTITEEVMDGSDEIDPANPKLVAGDMEGGAVSWTDVIGSNDASTVAVADEPEEDFANIDGAMSWDQLIGEKVTPAKIENSPVSTPAAASTSSKPDASFFGIGLSPEDKPLKAPPEGIPSDQPLSWNAVIGSSDTENIDEAESQDADSIEDETWQKLLNAMPDGFKPLDVPLSAMPEKTMTWGDVVGVEMADGEKES